MATVSLYLKRIQGSDCQIMLRISHKGAATAFYTGERVPEKIWDTKNQRVKHQAAGASEINRNIEGKKSDLEKLARDMEFEKPDKAFTIGDIRKRFVPMIREVDTRQDGELLAFVDKYLKAHPKLGEKTESIYQAVKSHLTKYEKAIEGKVSFSDAGADFIKDFYEFLQETIGDNTAHKYISRIKAVINWASTQGAKINATYRDFKTKELQKEIIFLTWDELKKLWALPPSPALDLYLFSCFTGMRWSDVMAFDASTDLRDGFIRIIQVKTKDKAVIPVNKYSKAILERNDFVLPRMEPHEVNTSIKALAAAVGINSKEKKVSYKKGERVEEIKFKFQLLTMHTGRSTFIMTHLMKAVSPLAVMRQTGHRDYNSFLKYVRFSDDMLREISDKVFN